LNESSPSAENSGDDPLGPPEGRSHDRNDRETLPSDYRSDLVEWWPPRHTAPSHCELEEHVGPFVARPNIVILREHSSRQNVANGVVEDT